MTNYDEVGVTEANYPCQQLLCSPNKLSTRLGNKIVYRLGYHTHFFPIFTSKHRCQNTFTEFGEGKKITQLGMFGLNLSRRRLQIMPSSIPATDNSLAQGQRMLLLHGLRM